MTDDVFTVGQQVTLFAEFENALGLPADPDTITLQIGRRDGHVLATHLKADLTNPVVGRWEYAYVIAEPDLRFSWDATGTVTMAIEGQIPTRRRTLARPA